MKKAVLLSALMLAVGLSPAFALSVTSNDDASQLVEAILGPGISYSNAQYTGHSQGSGFFTDGISSGLGIDSGIILTSGFATGAVGPNNSSGYTGTHSELPGDSNLSSIVGEKTYDASVLEFDFQSAGGDLFFNYVFASEEYNEYVNQYNDVFAFFLDGKNIALVPGTTTAVSINSVNKVVNNGFYLNNDGSVPTDANRYKKVQYDGMTIPLTATALNLDPGTHHIKLAIADTRDNVLDSGVFIQAGSFSDQPVVTPEPASMILFGLGGAALALRRKFSSRI